MSEATPEVTPAAAAPAATATTDPPADSTDTDEKDWKAEADKWQALARKHEDRSKANAGAAKELADLRKSAMTEQEKAVAEAEERGKTTARTESSKRLARAEFRAEAAGVVDKKALDGFLEYADLTKFVGEDGEPDSKAITAAVKKIAGAEQVPDFDGGARRTSKTTDMNSLIRQQAGF